MILCSTDLSVASEPALKAAAAVAKKQSLKLLLVTVLERENESPQPSPERRLERDAVTLRREFTIDVEICVLSGVPEDRLLALAKERGAKLIVVAAEGGSQHSRRLGSVPEHLCQSASVPVLVARNAEGLVAWSRDARPLNVLLGSGLGDTSASALACVGAWPDLNLTIAHVAWPYGEHYRLGLQGAMPLDHLRSEVQQQLAADLGRWAAEVPCRTPPHLQVISGWGRVDSHLAQLAEGHGADLLVVGSHQRNLVARVWQGSISRHAMHEADCNVLCVPQQHALARIAAAPRVVVIPTDFSVLADRAIRYGYAPLAYGATVHLVHVASDIQDAERARLRDQLEARVPAGADARGIATEVHIVEGSSVWLAIWQHASRAGAELICMSTHSRDAVGSLVLGSQAQALLQHSRVPVLLIPPDRES